MIGLHWAKFERNRIPLPTDVVRSATRSGLNGTETIDCWLVVLRPGRYRLAGADAVSNILSQIEEAESPGELLDSTDSDSDDSLSARLIPCRVSPPRPMWRLNFPKEAMLLVPDGERTRYLAVRVVAGFIELWFPDALRRALSVPLSEILP